MLTPKPQLVFLRGRVLTMSGAYEEPLVLGLELDGSGARVSVQVPDTADVDYRDIQIGGALWIEGTRQRERHRALIVASKISSAAVTPIEPKKGQHDGPPRRPSTPRK